MNRLLLETYQAAGIAFSASVSSILQTIFFILFLHWHLKLPFHHKEYVQFFKKYLTQLGLYCLTFWLLFKTIYTLISKIHFEQTFSIFSKWTLIVNAEFFLKNIGVWIWAGPLSLLLLWMLYSTRKQFDITLEYFDKN